MALLLACLATASDASSASSALAQTDDPQHVLADIKKMDRDQLSVSEEDGRFLRVVTVASGATRALEIGGAYGYSAIWIGLGLRETGGHLTSVESDPARAKLETENIRRAGLAGIVTVVSGDAFREIPRLPGDLDRTRSA